jgi:hypothetical protein
MPVDRNSSNELLTEMLRELLAERGRDVNDGLTLRALDRRLTDHSSHDDRMWDRIDDRLRKVEQEAARGAARDDMNIPTPAAFPVAPIAINMGGGNPKSKRPSLPSIMKSAAKPALHWAGVVLIVAASHLLTRCGMTGVPPIPSAGPPPAASR